MATNTFSQDTMEGLVLQFASMINNRPSKQLLPKDGATSLVTVVRQVVPSNSSSLLGSTALEQSLLHHWLSYMQLHLFPCASIQELMTKLQYVDSELANREYLCGFSLSAADLLLHLLLQTFVKQWTYQQKEGLCNISRWLQCVSCSSYIKKIKQTAMPFSRTLLYSETSLLAL